MGSWVWSPQARRSMFMTIPEKYKLWSVVLWSKNFEKLVRFFFEKIFSSKIFHWISEQNNFSTNIFEREKIAKCWYFRDFFSRKCGSKKYFCSEIQWNIFEYCCGQATLWSSRYVDPDADYAANIRSVILSLSLDAPSTLSLGPWSVTKLLRTCSNHHDQSSC